MDFQKLISEAKARYKPQCDYSAQSHVALISFLVIAEYYGFKCVVRILSNMDPDLDPKEVFIQADRIARSPNPINLEYLYRIYPHEEPLCFLVELNRNIDDIAAEMDKRVENYPIGRAVIRLVAIPQEQSLERLTKQLHIDRIPVHQDKMRRQDPGDFQGIGLLNFVERYDKLKTNAIGEVEGSRSPTLPKRLDLPSSDPPPWDELHPWLFTQFLEKMVRGLLPALQGELEDPKSARQEVRNDWEKSRAKKRGGSGAKNRSPRTIEIGLDGVDWEPDNARLNRHEGVWKQDPRRIEILNEMGLMALNDEKEDEEEGEEAGETEREYRVEMVRSYKNSTSCNEINRQILELYGTLNENITALAKEMGYSRATISNHWNELKKTLASKKIKR